MRPNRAERQVRNVGRSLFWLSALFLGLSIYSTAKFGWGFGIEIDDKITFATMAAGVDIFGAALMVVCGLCFGRKHYKAGVAAFIGIVACGIASAVGIYGFQSSNRIGVAHAREKAAEIDRGALEWFKSLAITGPKGDRQERIGDVKEQLGKLKGSLTELEPDTQATELAATFGVTADSARRAITMGGSILILAAQFTCLWFCAYLRQSVEPEVASIADDFTPRFHATQLQLNEEKARADLLSLIAEGRKLSSNREAAERWGVDESTAHRYIKRLHAAGLVKTRRKGRRKEIYGALNGHARDASEEG